MINNITVLILMFPEHLYRNVNVCVPCNLMRLMNKTEMRNESDISVLQFCDIIVVLNELDPV